MSILRAPQGPATQWEIGAAPFLSINTVKAYNTSLYRKPGVASRHDAVTAAPPRYRYTPRAIAHKLSTAHRFHDAVVQRLSARASPLSDTPPDGLSGLFTGSAK
ncbi:LuxR C-terminal-related transcriptional regulator [Streptomyces sp. MA5143a]|uniref:LuxR C-terminal-related transcriptional regulator n=1 Tax=Streptomyces sp. MA5143a TaxID=2083010 RepID=UPI000D2DAA0E|nr:LuxR C-terminal-related transcriptional regulator [Streptomyces sp. MA5143a]SPF04814.1 hypothetical protein SMA5143A_5616 [Streptomyces sp. MA5143a]